MDATADEIIRRWGVRRLVEASAEMKMLWFLLETKYVILLDGILDELRAADGTRVEKFNKLTHLLWYMQYQFYLDSREYVREDAQAVYSVMLEGLEKSKDCFVN